MLAAICPDKPVFDSSYLATQLPSTFISHASHFTKNMHLRAELFVNDN